MILWRKRPGQGQPRRLKLGSASFWLETIALPGCALALEAVVLGAWLQLFATWTSNDPAQALLPSWALFLILLAAFWLARWLAARRLRRRWPALVIILGWVVLLLIIWYLRLFRTSSAFWQVSWLATLLQDVQTDSGQISSAIGLAFIAAVLWWRGILLGRSRLEMEDISRSFKFGFGALVVALLLIGTASSHAREALGVQLGLALPIFLFLGLAALSLSRLADIRRRRRERSGSPADPTRSWMMSLLAISGALVLLVLGIEQLFSFQTWLALLAWLKPVGDAIVTLIGWIVLGIAFVFYWVYYLAAKGFLALFGGGQHKATSTQPPIITPPTLPQNSNSSGIPTEWQVIIRYSLIVIGAAILLLILWRAFRTFSSWRHDDAADEERESLGAARVMGAQLRALLAALAARFQRAATEGRGAGELPANTIRLLYRRVLQQAAMRGSTRASTETPQEFAQRLAPALLGQQAARPISLAPADGKTPDEPRLSQQTTSDADLEALTAAYEQARYGNREPSPPEVTALSERTEHLLRRLGQGQASR
ncbi:MAG TPA: DUF4129 domain-containing protein [Ktedonobacterales bacterium]|nr:DUF4129 domain-containing protein [Ktedonobacterales bacterium]